MTQGRLFALMSELYGDVPLERFKKLKEEFRELDEVVYDFMLARQQDRDTDGFFACMIDELADLNAVIFHLAGILGYSPNKLLQIAGDKIRGRIKNPDYKRHHPHKNHVHGVQAVQDMNT